jgi:hypothetical protein
MIHGNNVSIGCLAMGDEAAEELFVLAADVGLESVEVVVSPVDFRTTSLPSSPVPTEPWISGLYDDIRARLTSLPH